MATNENHTLEQRIVDTARQVFIEKGFEETSMSSIATRVGINRSVLHYYFRTKDRMFEAVCGDIIYSFLPLVQDAIVRDAPLRERVAAIVDIYMEVFGRNPLLPLFMAREIQRDMPHFLQTVRRLNVEEKAKWIRDYLLGQMDAGYIRKMPIEYLFYTFYGLLTFPWLSRPVAEAAFDEPGREWASVQAGWKELVTNQMTCLLESGSE